MRKASLVDFMDASTEAAAWVDADMLLRAFLVERWLSVSGPVTAGGPAGGPGDIVVAGRAWTRVPIRTDLVAPGDQVVAKTAWTVADTIAELVTEKSYRDGLRGPWFAVLAGKTG